MEIIFIIVLVIATITVVSHLISVGEEGKIEVVKDSKTLSAYAHDISVFTKMPTEIYYPKNVKDIVHLVKSTLDLKKTNPSKSLTVRAGGTCMSGGALTDSSVVDMTKYMKNVSIDAAAQTATVEMGAYFRDIETAAAKHGLMFAPYPSSHLICGIGGMIGNNASGEKSIRFGATSDNILSMEVVLADGTVAIVGPKDIAEITDEREKAILKLAQDFGGEVKSVTGKVKKAASGYRLEKVLEDNSFNAVPLFAGAQGTLGIVTKAVLKLVPIPEHLSLLVVSAQKLEDIPVIVDEIFKWNPEAIETFDANTFAKAREHLAQPAARTLEYVDADGKLFILAEFGEATKEETEAKADACFAALQAQGYYVKAVIDKDDITAVWEVRRNSFLLMRDHNPVGFKAVPCIEDVIVPVPALAEFISALHKILDKRGINYGFHGHIGDGSLRIVPVFDTKSPALIADITGLMEEVFQLIKRLKGNISADHSDGIIRSPFLKDFYGDKIYGAFKQIKNIYDPLNIFNPGKKVEVEISEIEKYFDKGK